MNLKSNVSERLFDIEQTKLKSELKKYDGFKKYNLKETIAEDLESFFKLNNKNVDSLFNEAEILFPNIQNNKITNKLIQHYQKNLQFKKTIETISQNVDKKESVAELSRIIDILQTEYVVDKYINLMDKLRASKLKELYAKMKLVEESAKFTKSFGNTFGRFWDLSYHDLYNLDMNFISKMQELMNRKDYIKKIAELLGRAADSLKEYEEQLIEEMKVVRSYKNFEYSPENVIGLTLGNHIPDVLSSSLMLLKNPKTRKIFKKLYIEKKLLQFDKKINSKDVAKSFETKMVPKKTKKGPFIIVVDTSGSMHGEPEAIAKAMTLAIASIAAKDKRKCYIINFSTTTIEFDASDIRKNWKSLYDFLSKSFSGGTDINPAIESAIKKVKHENYINSDVLFISDLIINSLDDDLRNEVKKLKKKNIRFHALTIGNSYNEKVIDFFDNNWIYDGSKKSIDNIIRSLDKYES